MVRNLGIGRSSCYYLRTETPAIEGFAAENNRVKNDRQIPPAQPSEGSVVRAIWAFRQAKIAIRLRQVLPVRDKKYNVIHSAEMVTTTRAFLRSFSAFKARARKGETVRVQDREGEFLFTAATAKRSLLGAAKGKIAFHDDLTRPTLPNESWQPSL
jgi:hypothetical protein